MASMATVLGATLLEFTGALRQSNVGERMLAYIEADAAQFAILARVQEFFAGLEPRHRALPAVQEVREQLALPRRAQTDSG